MSCSYEQLRHSITLPQGSSTYRAFSPYILAVSPICLPSVSTTLFTVTSRSGVVTAMWKKPPRAYSKDLGIIQAGSMNSKTSNPTPFPQANHAHLTFCSLESYILKIDASGVSLRSVVRSERMRRKPKVLLYHSQASSQLGTLMAT
jgi:hypothetical protein